MKRKVLMIMLCMGLSFSMITACGNAEPENNEVQEEENEETPEEEESDPEEEVPEEEEVQVVENEMATEDAFDAFLANELTVTVEYPEDLEADQYVYYPGEGVYTYSELIEALGLEDFADANVTEMNVQYTLFTPAMGDDEVLAILVGDGNTVDYRWMGFIAYTNNELVMKYSTTFGYRSFFDLYEGGYVLHGGSGGAGASYENCAIINTDSSFSEIYNSGHFYSTWANEASYYVAPDLAYDLRPSLPEEDGDFEAIVVTGVGEDTYMYVVNYSEDETMREAEDEFIAALEGLGMVVVEDESEISLDIVLDTDDFVPVEWVDFETIEL